jgi:hypothetical protein
MNKLKIVFTSFLLVLFTCTTNIYAHPGRTASDGCHYCRTNCDSWGVAWNQRHCHGGGGGSSYSAPAYVAPVVRCRSEVGNSGSFSFTESSCSQNVKFTWDKGTNDTYYSIGISKTAGADPGPVSDTTSREYTFRNIKPGTWYINLKTWSGNCTPSQVMYWKIEVPQPSSYLTANIGTFDNKITIDSKCMKSISSYPSIGRIEANSKVSILPTLNRKTAVKVTGYPMYGKAITKEVSFNPERVIPTPPPPPTPLPTPKPFNLWKWLF